MEMDIDGYDESSQDTVNDDSDDGNTSNDETWVETDVSGHDTFYASGAANKPIDDLVALF